MLYYIIFSVLAFFSLFEMVTVSQQAKKAVYISICLLFIALGSLRWNTGTDWRPYYTFFTNFTTENPFFLIAMEPGFVQLVKILRIFSSDFTFYLTFLSVFTIGTKTAFFYKYSESIFLALILYWGITLSDITAVRQSLAIGICLVATHYIITGKRLHFVFFVVLAAQIHVTAYIYLLAYPVYYAKWSIKYKCLFLLIAIIFGSMSVSMNILELLLNYTPKGIGLDRISSKAQDYIEIGNETDYGSEVSRTQKLVTGLLKRSVLLPIFFFFQGRFGESREKYDGFLNLYTFGNIIFFLVVDFSTLQRAATYFYIFEILLFCILYANVRSKSIWMIIIILYSLFKLVSVIAIRPDLLIPYIWIFSEDTFRYTY